MRIRSHWLWFTTIGFGGLVLFVAPAFTTPLRVETNGPVYVLSQHPVLVPDYVPPSESLLEVALIGSMMNESDYPAERARCLPGGEGR
jgi:hypothetical protein